MNYLCICSGGIVRSGACAALLRDQGADAIPVSSKNTSTATFDLMCRWANRIIVMQPQFAERVTPEYRHKVVVFDIGPDVWANPLHPDLLAKISAHIIGMLHGKT